jgi:5'/3'-nucleotidase SurE
MHVLVVNDDGPPSAKSPYVRYLVDALQKAGHSVSVVLPDGQRSWIGKAHLINEDVKCTPSQAADEKGWVLVNSTPAACVHVGLHHCPLDQGPVDVVISGPNFGYNASALFSLSSGTLGAAFEATLCRKRAVALSYSQARTNHPDAISATARHSVKIIESLVNQWPEGDQSLLYSINIPVSVDIASREIVWTETLQNFWGLKGAFVDVQESLSPISSSESTPARTCTRLLKWNPDLDYKTRTTSGPQPYQDVVVLDQGNMR